MMTIVSPVNSVITNTTLPYFRVFLNQSKGKF